jgi:peptide/nickel transport system substrate-binding protein
VPTETVARALRGSVILSVAPQARSRRTATNALSKRSESKCSKSPAVAILALVLTACNQHAAATGETLRVAFGTEPHSLNPIAQQNGQEIVIDRLFSDTLTTFDPTGNTVIPILASSVPTRANGDVSPDGKTIVFHLRHGVKWQDGAPFTSADVAFTFAQVMNPRNDVVTRFGYDDVKRLETPNPYTVRLRLFHPFAPIVTTFFGDANTPYGILPRHLLRIYSSMENIPFNALPIGTGPFRVVSWHRGDRIELDANPNYFRGPPRLAHITVVFSRNEQTLVTLARSREIEWAAELSPAAAPEARNIPGYHVVLVPQNRWYGLSFNMQRAVVRDIRIRRAIEMSIDKKSLARTLTYDTALPATQDLPSFLWASPKLPPSPYDPAAARALMALAGWTPASPLHLETAYNVSDQTARKAIVVLQSALASSGIALDPKGYPNEMLTGAASTGGIMESGRFDVILARILNGPEPDNSAEYGCAAVSPNGYNFARYCSQEMERLQRIATTSYDREIRRHAYTQIETLLESDLPQIPLWWPRDVHIVSNRLQNFNPNPFVETWDAYNWKLAQ